MGWFFLVEEICMLEREAEQLAQWLVECFDQQLSQSGVNPTIVIAGNQDPSYSLMVGEIDRVAAMQKALLLVAGSMGEVHKVSIPEGSHGLTLIKSSGAAFFLTESNFSPDFWDEESLQFLDASEAMQNFPGISRHIADEKLCLVTKGGLNCNLLLIGGLLGLSAAQYLLDKLVNLESVYTVTLVDLSTGPGHPDYFTGKYLVMVAGYPWSLD
jgi:hypothetical protein